MRIRSDYLEHSPASWAQFARILVACIIVTILQVENAKAQYSSKTIQLDASTIKKPYLYGPDELTKLARLDHQIYRRIQEYIRDTREKLKVLQKWKADYKETSFRALIPGFIEGFKGSGSLPEQIIAGHPLLAYRMIRRYTKEFPDIIQYFNSTTEESKPARVLLKSLDGLEKTLRYGWPTSRDLEDSIDSIIKIQDVYDFSASEVAVGDFSGISTGINIGLQHIIEIGKHASRTQRFVVALNWLQLAKKVNAKIKDGGYKKTDTMIQEEITNLVEKHNANWKVQSFTPGPVQMNYFSRKLPTNCTDKPRARTLVTVKQFGLNLLKGNLTIQSVLLDYYAVCRGENFQPRQELHQLKCWYDRKTSPELLVYPAKIEQLSIDPPVVKIYDAIGTKAVEALKRLSVALQYVEIYKPESDSTNETTADVEYFKSRASANSWIPDSTDINLRLLSRRFESLTGLNLVGDTASDHFEVVAYSCGGSFVIHKDALEEAKTELRGDRISTLLIYLNNVTLGGRTAFPRIGTAIKPEAGTAIMWYNLFPNGEVDERTTHAACPVVLGHKWSVNKCPTEHGNFLRRKCPSWSKSSAWNQKHQQQQPSVAVS